MATRFCLIRHGVTDWNYEGRAQGRTDIPLNAEGRRQAAAVAARVATEAWDAIYSSPLSRAAETARIVAAETGHEVQTDPRLMERYMGPAEGTTYYERQLRWPGLRLSEIPGVETSAEMAARGLEALREIAARHPGGRVICVAHGGLIRSVLDAVSPPEGEQPPRRSPIRNTGIARLIFDDGRFLAEGEPDHRHILEDGVEFSGEKGRINGRALETLGEILDWDLPADSLSTIVTSATAIEAAWVEDELVAFVRAFTDGVLRGYIDIAAARPAHQHLIPRLVERMEARYPSVSFTHLTGPGYQVAGD